MGEEGGSEGVQLPNIEALSIGESADLEQAKRDWGLIRKSISSGWE